MDPAPPVPPASDEPIAGVATAIAAFVGYFADGPILTAQRVASIVDFDRDFGGLSRVSLASYAVHQFFVNGGNEAWIVRTASGGTDASALPDGPDLIAALAALDTVDLFNMLCLPDTERLPDAGAPAVLSAAIACAGKRRAIYLMDLPQRDAARDQAGAVEAWLETHPQLRSPNAALYFPRPTLLDPLDRNLPRALPASGTIAGLYARVDAARGVWKAPAGRSFPLKGLSGLEREVTDAQGDRLNTIGVNALRTFDASGPLAWGARTLAGADTLASQWKYLPVIRMALFLEESVTRGTRVAAGEVNGEPLWSRIRLRAGTFLHGLFVRGAFQGATSREAFLLKCDSDTTTAADVSAGVVNIVIGFAPLKAAEFVIIRIQQRLWHDPPDA